LKLLRKF
jgi:dynein heavy chain